MSNDTVIPSGDYDVDTQPAAPGYTVDTESGTVLTESPPMTESDKRALVAAGIFSVVIVVCMIGMMILYTP